jgi:hypothetical protein
MMKEFKWTYDELLATPFHVIVSIGFIKDSVKTFKKLNDLKKKDKE